MVNPAEKPAIRHRLIAGAAVLAGSLGMGSAAAQAAETTANSNCNVPRAVRYIGARMLDGQPFRQKVRVAQDPTHYVRVFETNPRGVPYPNKAPISEPLVIKCGEHELRDVGATLGVTGDTRIPGTVHRVGQSNNYFITTVRPGRTLRDEMSKDEGTILISETPPRQPKTVIEERTIRFAPQIDESGQQVLGFVDVVSGEPFGQLATYLPGAVGPPPPAA